MKLDEFYQRIGPFLLGHTAHPEAVRALYGADPPARHQRDAERLRIYGRFCATHRAEVLDSVYTACRRVVVQRRGAPAWSDLVEAYFRAHPMHHFELNRNGRFLPEFLQHAAAPELPAFLPELADFDWWEWQTYSAPDDEADRAPDSGPLRLGSTVEMRPYQYDFVTWFDDSDETGEPPRRANVVMFWRDRDRDARRAHISPLEMRIIKAVVEAVPLDDALAARIGVPAADLHDTVADLHAAGILLGAL